MERFKEFLAAIKDWTKQKWDALRRRRCEARICARIDELEARICGGLVEFIKPISVPVGDEGRTVRFQGVELPQRFYAEGLKRITETLYRTGGGQYLVHVRTLHRGKGLRTEYALYAVSGHDLEEGGKYAALGRLNLPLTMEEALEAQCQA